MKALIAVAVASLCFLAMTTVRVRSLDALLAYQIARLDRMRNLLEDRLLALQAEATRRAAVSRLLGRAAAMRIEVQLEGFGSTDVAVVPATEEGGGTE